MMEAKDIVIRDTKKAKKDLREAKLPTIFSYREAYYTGCQAQSELSFKAGMREVVEWIKTGNIIHDINWAGGRKEWQAQLEKWEIEDDNS